MLRIYLLKQYATISNMSKQPWWKKHTIFESDKIVKMVEDSPEKFMISRTEILQLVLDFKKLKNKFINICHYCEAQEEWDALPDNLKEEQRTKHKKIEEELRKIFE